MSLSEPWSQADVLFDDLVSIARDARKFVQMVRDDAESRHDSYGDEYMSGGLYEIMGEADALLKRIDAATWDQGE